MKRLPAYLFAAMTLPMLGVWSASSYAGEHWCIHDMDEFIKYTLGRFGNTSSIVPKTHIDFVKAEIKDPSGSAMHCYYRYRGQKSGWAFISSTKKKQCIPGNGFKIRNSGATCTKKGKKECRAVCN